MSKELDFARKTGLSVIGLIENMSGYLCPHCKEVQHVFGGGGGQAFCTQVTAEAAQDSSHVNPGLKFLGKVPIDVEFMKLMDQAMWTDPNKKDSQIADDQQPRANWDLIRRYADVPSSKSFEEICQQITRAIEEQSAITMS